ncbi:MAG: hypothetical protein AVDCRST_MAG55-2685, partial [uncultured Rubrobacteraceae bacterium]
ESCPSARGAGGLCRGRSSAGGFPAGNYRARGADPARDEEPAQGGGVRGVRPGPALRGPDRGDGGHPAGRDGLLHNPGRTHNAPAAHFDVVHAAEGAGRRTSVGPI